jgi:hypothetical protein
MNRVKDVGITHPKPYLTPNEGLQVKQQINVYLDKKIEEWNNGVPFAQHLESKNVNMEYYKRHTIEHVWRIRMSRITQCKVLHNIAKYSPEAAQLYARYQDQEMLHDTLFAQDLKALGITEEEIWNTEPLLSTRLLQGFLYWVGEHEHPIGVIAYSYLVEYTSNKLTPKQLVAMKESIGQEKIKGQVSHMNTDMTENHSDEMWNIVRHLIFKKEDIDALYKYFDEIQEILAMYFKEVYEKTILKSKKLTAVGT